MPLPNQNPKQIARDTIDLQLHDAGWVIQAKDAINFHEGIGQALRQSILKKAFEGKLI